MFNIFNQALAQQAHFVIQNLNYAHNSQTMLELPQDSLRTSFTLKIQRIYKIMCVFSWSPWSSNGNQIDSTPDHILAQLHSIVTKYVCMHTDAVLFIQTYEARIWIQDSLQTLLLLADISIPQFHTITWLYGDICLIYFLKCSIFKPSFCVTLVYVNYTYDEVTYTRFC